MIDTAILQQRIAGRAPDYLRDLFGEAFKPAGTDKWRVGRHGSLAIAIRDGALLYYCHESGTGGDAIALWQRQRGGSMGDALQAAAGWAQVGDDGASRQRPRRAPRPLLPTGPAPEPLAAAQLWEAHVVSRRLAGDAALCAQIARDRCWLPETVKGAALDGVLGWSDGWSDGGYTRHRGALAFIYPCGIKHRWRRGDSRIIRWHCGKPAALWRGSMILPATRKVFITEGETDTLSLLDAGAETSEPVVAAVVVVALPSAGILPWGIADQLAGREVVLCFDQDPAGRQATERITAAIGSRVASLKTWRAPR